MGAGIKIVSVKFELLGYELEFGHNLSIWKYLFVWIWNIYCLHITNLFEYGYKFLLLFWIEYNNYKYLSAMGSRGIAIGHWLYYSGHHPSERCPSNCSAGKNTGLILNTGHKYMSRVWEVRRPSHIIENLHQFLIINSC